jgi:hypothetical protein
LRDAVNTAAQDPSLTSSLYDSSRESDVSGPRSFPLGIFVLLLPLAGCGSSSVGTSSGTNEVVDGGTTTGGSTPPSNPIGSVARPTGSNDSVVATASVAGTVAVVVGGSRTVSIAFTSSDGRAISGFGVSGNLGTLPTGWSGPASFSCASVDTGSSCVLNLTYAPMAADSGTLTLEYVFVDDSTMPSTGGSISIAFAATPDNNVVAAVSPTGQVNAAAGSGKQSVSVNFTTDDGYAATDLTVSTDLAALPSGWTSAVPNLTCAIVSSGSGCQLALSYAPTSSSRGTLTLNYSFTDDAGVARTGKLNIPYAASSQGNVVAAVSPAGQVNAIEKTGGQAVAITFNTDDGTTTSGLYLTSDLAKLPAGWSSASNGFSCGSVGTGNGCQLHLTYVPTALTRGSVSLNYAYGGGTRAGSLNFEYAATTNDNVVGTASPTGQINAVVGSTPQSIAVTFTTDDGRPATALQLTNDPASLPAGWSSPASFTCSGLSTGTGCQLTLSYAPPAADSDTLALGYSYLNDAGQAKTGTVNIAYRATTDDTINGIGSPASVTATIGGGGVPVSVTFATNDGNLATNFLLTSDLAALPTDWSSASSTLSCANVSAGSACQLSLTYSPTAAPAPGASLSLTYSYNDDSGTSKTGTVSIPYTATP